MKSNNKFEQLAVPSSEHQSINNITNTKTHGGMNKMTSAGGNVIQTHSRAASGNKDPNSRGK